LLLLFVIGAVALGAGTFMSVARRTLSANLRYVPPHALAPAPPASPAALAQAEQSVRNAARAVARAERQATAARARPAAEQTPSASYEIVFSEADLNTLLQASEPVSKALTDMGVTNPRVTLGKNRLRVTGLVPLPPELVSFAAPAPDAPDAGNPDETAKAPTRFYVSLEASGADVEPKTGTLRLRLRTVEVGKIAAPAAIVGEVERRLAQIVADLVGGSRKPRLPGRLEEVRLEDGQIVLRGIVPPASTPNQPK